MSSKRPNPPAKCGPLLTATGPCTTTGTHKRCSVCKEWLPHKEFNKNKYKFFGLKNICRKCRSKTHDKNKNYKHHLKRTWNLTLEDYDALLESQNGGCAICGALPINRRLSVDHDHETGEIRGLLCSNCNTGIGLLGEDLTRLASAMNYLRKFK